MIGLYCCDIINVESIIAVDGMGSPINVFVGSFWFMEITLYLVNLSIPVVVIISAIIIVYGVFISCVIIIAGAIANEVTSDNESMFSPNIWSWLSFLVFLAIIPSSESNITASIRNFAVSWYCPDIAVIMASIPESAFASEIMSAIDVIFIILVSV